MTQVALKNLRMRLIGHLAVSILTLACAVWLVHVAAHWLVNTEFNGANPKQLESLVYLAQALLVGIFVLIIGSFVHRYPESFFLFWYFGWISWLVLYSARFFRSTGFLQHAYLEAPFDLLNTCFFLAAGVDLLLPKSLDRFFRCYPKPPAKAFGSPAMWMARYYRNNPCAWILLTPVAIFGLGQFSFTLRRIPVPAWFQNCEGLLAITSVALLGYGLYRRLVKISPRTAYATLFVYAIYLEPQIARLLWKPYPGHEFDYLFTSLAPSLVLKPALALFVALVALRETVGKRDEARRRLTETTQRANAMVEAVVQNLPAACLLVREGKIVLLNATARELLSLRSGNGVALEAVFASPTEHNLFLAKLRREHGRTLGHHTKIVTNGCIAGPKTVKWVRIDAFETNAVASECEIVLLILDRHEVELAHIAFSFVHDFLFPRVRALSGSVTQSLAQLRGSQRGDETAQSEEYLKHQWDSLLEGIALFREEYSEYWRVHPRTLEGAVVEPCIDVAWAQAERTCSVALNCEPRLVKLGHIPEGTKTQTISERNLFLSLQNLFINAIQHTHRREHRPELTPIEVELSYREGWVTIRISDHGCGFTDRVISFLHDANSVSAENIGLGLFGVKLKVAGAGGQVGAGNQLNNSGGWVEIQLPAAVPQTGIAGEATMQQGEEGYKNA